MYLSTQSLLLDSSLLYSDSQNIKELIYWANTLLVIYVDQPQLGLVIFICLHTCPFTRCTQVLHTTPRDRYLYQEKTPLRDIYQEDPKQILTKYLEEEAKPIANTRIQLKPWLNYSVLHRIGRKELAIKAIYFTLAFAYTFISTLLQPQQIRITKGLPLELCNQKEAINSVFKKE